MREEHEIIHEFKEHAHTYFQEYNNGNMRVADEALEKSWSLMKEMDSLDRVSIFAKNLTSEDTAVRLVSGILLLQSKKYGEKAYSSLDQITNILPMDMPVRMSAVGYSALYKINVDHVKNGGKSVLPITVA